MNILIRQQFQTGLPQEGGPLDARSSSLGAVFEARYASAACRDEAALQIDPADGSPS